MKNETYLNNGFSNLFGQSMTIPRQLVVGLILVIALFAFEIFNFDTTRYALANLLGDVRFAGLQWASILAIAFCAIDFAGLVRFFTPDTGQEPPKEIWYLMGAWLLGATMNAMMTWWAVSLTLLNHQFGNEVLGRDTLLTIVPVFVAVLVWLTRILFIGALSVSGNRFFQRPGVSVQASADWADLPSLAELRALPLPQPTDEVPAFIHRRAARQTAAQSEPPSARPQPQTVVTRRVEPVVEKPAAAPQPRREEITRVRQRPPVPTTMRPNPGIQARPKS